MDKLNSKKPKAVLISDIHFTVSTLELASSALKQAMNKAVKLDIPLIIAGDLLDSKAIIRGEVANRLIEIFRQNRYCWTYLLVGNHDLLNEKGKEHSLNFLSSYCRIIDSYQNEGYLHFIPYQSNTTELKEILSKIPKQSTIIMHQGLATAYMGHYVQDKTSLPPEAFDGYRVISGHYHRAQNIKCGDTGLFSYIGSPYTTSFAESDDGHKGFQILFDDGSLEQVRTDLRRHIIVEMNFDESFISGRNIKLEDLVWLKVYGPKSELDKIDKKELGMKLFGHNNYKLDKIPLKNEDRIDPKLTNLTESEIFDSIIDKLQETKEEKEYLKALWKEIIE